MIADRKARLTSLTGVVVLHLLLGWALLLSLAPSLVRGGSESLDVFNVRQVPPPPPNPPEPEPKAEPRTRQSAPAPAQPAGKAASPRPRSQPPGAALPKVVREVRPPVAAGLVPATGGETTPIASDRPGTGAGSGGSGSGTGSAGSGSGTGGGGAGGSGAGGRIAVPARFRSGRIVGRDYPRAARGHQGVVATRLTVSATGAVTGCRVVSSSGNAVLDGVTCQLIRERFRFAPARDAQGNPVPSITPWRQSWWQD